VLICLPAIQCDIVLSYRLEFYGVELFPARDHHGTELGLGITGNVQERSHYHNFLMVGECILATYVLCVSTIKVFCSDFQELDCIGQTIEN